MKKTAIVMFNLGGPDNLDAVEPFLFNLFNDPAIIGAPSLIRWFIARLISKRRAPIAKEIYETLGGRSPLVPLTQEQADALIGTLNAEDSDHQFAAFIAMRYWHPMSLEAAEAVRKFGPDDIILLPLYPQYSTTTTGSSIAEWHRAAKAVGVNAPTRAICCYPTNAGWIDAQTALVTESLNKCSGEIEPRVLFSAHGLPKKVIAKGDPYQWQVEQTVGAIVDRLHKNVALKFSWTTCYQSRVGPLEWIGPSTDDELKRAGKDGVPVVVVPVAFVSEHSETLVELDIEYRDLATECGVPAYHRVPAVGTQPQYIEGLATMIKDTINSGGNNGSIRCEAGNRICPSDRSQCPLTVM